jgi:eukaryotic-like serine/threonine-protein kinase
MAALPSGARLGPYEILAPLGAGGMGEVYRARDTRLGRTVAIKLLNAELSGNPISRERFEREARSIAALTHPHICTVHDVGDHEGNAFLVMELLEGPTLAARLARTQGGLPLDEALSVATHVAEALAFAHRHHITHRDIKPANIMLAPTGVKLLDFGLAQLRDRDEVTGQSGTPTSLTGPLGVMGTLAYMSPEQLDGRADQRSDIFAFGVVLFEMLTGRKAFDGATSSAVIGAVVHTDPPPVSSLRAEVSPSLVRVVRRCLAKDPDARWQSTLDLVDELRWIAGHATSGGDAIESPARARPGRRLAVTALALTAAVAIGVAVGSQLRLAPPPEPTSVRFVVTPPEDFSFRGMMALSPDGQRLALVTIDDKRRTQLWVRSMSSEVPQRVAAADGATYPFWSPDGQSIGFFADRQLKRVAAAGGPPLVICDAEDGRGGTWNKDGVIVFAPRTFSNLMRVSASGGTPQPVTQLDQLKYIANRWPHFLPDGDHFLYLADSPPGGQSALHVGSLGSPDSRSVLDEVTEGQYADGLLFFARRDVLLAQPFDVGRLALSGEPRAVAQGIATLASGRYAFSVTPSGALAFLRRTEQNPVARLTWFDRGGKPTGSVGQPGRFADPSIAPDGNRLAVTRSDDNGSAIWVFEMPRGTATPLASPGARPVWSPDGRRLVFSAIPLKGGPTRHLWTISADGSGLVPLIESKFQLRAHGWSPDGARLLYHLEFGAQDTASGLWMMTMPGSSSVPFRNDGFLYPQAALSPDGHWVAYASNQTGRYEIYVESFPTPGRRVQVSTDGGTQPRWRRDQRELYFLSAESRLLAVPANLGVEAKLGTATPLFTLAMPGGAMSGGPLPGGVGAVSATQYDVSADGRFLAAVVEPHVPDRPPVTVALNATPGLKPSPAR